MTKTRNIKGSCHPFRPAVIRWRDAHENSPSGWITRAEVNRDGYIVSTCAFVVELDDDMLTVCMDWGPDGYLRGVDHIPRGMVVSIEFLA